MTHKASNEKETEKLAYKLAKKLKPGDVLAFYGNLGAGKTTFVKSLALGLGIKNRIISPTFVIERIYEEKDFDFHHIDLYRINSEKEVEALGIIDLFDDPRNIVAIEWADKMENLLPKNTIRVSMEYIKDGGRMIKII